MNVYKPRLTGFTKNRHTYGYTLLYITQPNALAELSVQSERRTLFTTRPRPAVVRALHAHWMRERVFICQKHKHNVIIQYYTL